VVAPGPRAPAALARGEFDPPCPECAAPLDPLPVPESAPVDPRNVYAATKLHQEHLCRAFALEHSAVSVTTLRYHNVYGPRMPFDTPYAGVASIFRSALERDEAPRVFEDGRQRRDFVHVRDVARANVLALTVTNPYDGALNVASGEPRTVFEMAAALCEAFGSNAPRPRVVGGARPGDVRHVFASPELAATSLGFRAETDFMRGMEEFAVAALRV
jgi:dTDP-L-rhamnose 4-epimerase